MTTMETSQNDPATSAHRNPKAHHGPPADRDPSAKNDPPAQKDRGCYKKKRKIIEGREVGQL